MDNRKLLTEDQLAVIRAGVTEGNRRARDAEVDRAAARGQGRARQARAGASEP
jgi:hypothetical protein